MAIGTRTNPNPSAKSGRYDYQETATAGSGLVPCWPLIGEYQSIGWEAIYKDTEREFSGPVTATHRYFGSAGPLNTAYASPAGLFSDPLCVVPSTTPDPSTLNVVMVTGTVTGSAGGIAVSCTYTQGTIERVGLMWVVTLIGKCRLTTLSNNTFSETDTVEVRQGQFIIDPATNSVTCFPPIGPDPPAYCESYGDTFVASLPTLLPSQREESTED